MVAIPPSARPLLLVVVVALSVVPGCRGDDATPTTQPTRTACVTASATSRPVSTAMPTSPTVAGSVSAAVDDLTGHIAYSTAGPDGGIWVMDADGANQRQLTHAGPDEMDYDPAWSPDGTRIAFRTTRAGDGETEGILVVNVDGSGEDALGQGYSPVKPTWSPDGSRLAFHCVCPDGEGIYTANPDGSGLTQLTDDHGQYPDWSPDGTRIAYMIDPPGTSGHEIAVMHADGSNSRNLTNTPTASDSVPDWSPDSSQIVFFSDRDGNEEVYVMDADGSHVRRLTHTQAFEEFPVWTPDGRIVVSAGLPGSDAVTWFILNADGRNLQPLPFLSEAGAVNFIDWLPPHRGHTSVPTASPTASLGLAPATDLTGRIAYAAPDGIWVMQADGSERRQLGAVGDWDPSWAPDGTQLAVRSDRALPGEGDGIPILSLDGAADTLLTGTQLAGFPDWSRDGRLIAYASTAGTYVVARDGSAAPRLVAASCEYADWSPDGTRLAIMCVHGGGAPEIVVVALDGTVQQNLTNHPAGDRYPAWSPDGTLIAFTSDREGNEELYVMQTDGTGLRRLTTTPELSESFPVWAPDGRIAFVAAADGEQTGHTLVIAPDGSGLAEVRSLAVVKASFPVDWLP